MSIDKVGRLKFKNFLMYTNCNQSVYIFLFLCYILFKGKRMRIIICGVPRTGKTTLSKNLKNNLHYHNLIVSESYA